MMVGDLPIFVPIFSLNSGGARPFGARGEAISLYGRSSSSRSHAMRIARDAPRKKKVMSESSAMIGLFGAFEKGGNGNSDQKVESRLQKLDRSGQDLRFECFRRIL